MGLLYENRRLNSPRKCNDINTYAFKKEIQKHKTKTERTEWSSRQIATYSHGFKYLSLGEHSENIKGFIKYFEYIHIGKRI